MFKKIMSFMLATLILMSVAVMATSAAQVEIADNSAEAIAEVAADGAAEVAADGSAETGAAKKLLFDPSNTGWNNYKWIACHIWVYDGDSFFAWNSKAERCVDNKDGTWSYDLDTQKVALEDGVLYACIFYNDIGMQSHNLLFDTSVVGDTAYCKDPELKYENPEDSNKKSVAAFWKNQDESKYGPEMCVTSIGNVVGTCVPFTTSAQAMFVGFLKDTLVNARTFSGKDDQTLIDDTAKALNLKIGNVEEAIASAGVDVDWDASKSSLQEGTDESAKQDKDGNVVETPDDNKGNNKTDGGSKTDSDKKTDSDSDNKSDSSSNTNSSSTTSSTKTSGSTTKTGQETTVLYIMLGVMIAAAAVIVITRKKTRV